jgi:hypothetical protein
VKRQGKPEVGPTLRRAKPGSLHAVEKVAPNLGWAAADAPTSGAVGEAAGLHGARKGGGLLGAMARRIGLGASGDPSRSDQAAQVGHKRLTPKPAGIFVNHVHQPRLLAKAPSPSFRSAQRKAEPTPEATGQQRLSEALHQAAGRIGEFLKSSPVGTMLRAVEGLQDAMAAKATERLKNELFFLKV